mmetsp:Transcript_4105/g.10283  ORF Transcript_4105/g.10283 Transcript_4105/m.10283 type:complete len:354 (+) Transcript_4105:214-1275(+)
MVGEDVKVAAHLPGRGSGSREGPAGHSQEPGGCARRQGGAGPPGLPAHPHLPAATQRARHALLAPCLRGGDHAPCTRRDGRGGPWAWQQRQQRAAGGAAARLRRCLGLLVQGGGCAGVDQGAARARGGLAGHWAVRPPPVYGQDAERDRVILPGFAVGVEGQRGAGGQQGGAGGPLAGRLPGGRVRAEAPRARGAPGAGVPRGRAQGARGLAAQVPGGGQRRARPRVQGCHVGMGEGRDPALPHPRPRPLGAQPVREVRGGPLLTPRQRAGSERGGRVQDLLLPLDCRERLGRARAAAPAGAGRVGARAAVSAPAGAQGPRHVHLRRRGLDAPRARGGAVQGAAGGAGAKGAH